MTYIKFSLAALALVAATPVAAADFSFTGTLDDPDQVLFFDFTADDFSSVTLRTYSYAGGVNAAGQTIARGGFDPILSLYALSTGLRVGQNDDGGSAFVPADPVTGLYYDTFLQRALDPGNYRVAVTAFPNFAPSTLSGTFQGGGSFNGRTNAFAFDVLGVSQAAGPGGTPVSAVPEPATWAMMIVGLGAAGAALRRRRTAVRFAM